MILYWQQHGPRASPDCFTCQPGDHAMSVIDEILEHTDAFASRFYRRRLREVK
jgi:hypothetical protein